MHGGSLEITLTVPFGQLKLKNNSFLCIIISMKISYIIFNIGYVATLGVNI